MSMTREDRIAAMERYWHEVMKRPFDEFTAPHLLACAKRIADDVEADGSVSYDTLFEFRRRTGLDGNG